MLWSAACPGQPSPSGNLQQNERSLPPTERGPTLSFGHKGKSGAGGDADKLQGDPDSQGKTEGP